MDGQEQGVGKNARVLELNRALLHASAPQLSERFERLSLSAEKIGEARSDSDSVGGRRVVFDCQNSPEDAHQLLESWVLAGVPRRALTLKNSNQTIMPKPIKTDEEAELQRFREALRADKAQLDKIAASDDIEFLRREASDNFKTRLWLEDQLEQQLAVRSVSYVLQNSEGLFFRSYKQGRPAEQEFVESLNEAMLYAKRGTAQGVATKFNSENPNNPLQVKEVRLVLT